MACGALRDLALPSWATVNSLPLVSLYKRDQGLSRSSGFPARWPQLQDVVAALNACPSPSLMFTTLESESQESLKTPVAGPHPEQ